MIPTRCKITDTKLAGDLNNAPRFCPFHAGHGKILEKIRTTMVDPGWKLLLNSPFHEAGEGAKMLKTADTCYACFTETTTPRGEQQT